MKKIILSLLPFFVGGTVVAQTTASFDTIRMNNVYLNTIKTGMWSGNFRSGFIHQTNGSFNFGIYGNAASGFRFRWLFENNNAIDYSTDAREVMHLDSSGMLRVKNGITAPNPVFGSTVHNEYAKVVILGPNQPPNIGSKRDISFEFSSAGRAMVRSYRGSSWDTYLQFLTNPITNAGAVEPVVQMHIHHNGNVGIGTTNPQSRLAVNGDITATKVKVTQDGWADYVFDPAYELRSLKEVEAHIRNEQRLPDVPSAAQIEKEGLDLGDMQKIQMQKIEELTLYLIELKKENDKLKEKVAALEKDRPVRKTTSGKKS